MKINLLKYKNFFNDSMWSILGLTLMNLISQFVVYPVWHNYYGDEIYGHIIYVMSIINIFSIHFSFSFFNKKSGGFTLSAGAAISAFFLSTYSAIVKCFRPFSAIRSTGSLGLAIVLQPPF